MGRIGAMGWLGAVYVTCCAAPSAAQTAPPSAPPKAASIAPVATSAPLPEPSAWRLAGSHFVVSLERMATVAVWRDIEGYYGGGYEGKKIWGVEAALLTANSTRKSLSEPRIAFDYVLKDGLSFGGALGFVKTGGKYNKPNERLFLAAPRVGVLLVPTSNLGVWLRAGVTYWWYTTSHENHEEVPHDDGPSGEVPPPWVHDTWSTWNATLEPQLLFCVAPRIAISAGGFIDRSLTGQRSQDFDTEFSPYETDWETSSYGISAGMAAIF